MKAQLRADTEVKIESYKATLKAQGDIALEQLKSSLATEAHRRNVTVAGLLQRRFDAISAVYFPLRAFVDAASDYVKVFEPTGGDSREVRSQRVADAQLAFREVFHQHAIFLSRSSADQIAKIEQQVTSASNVFLYTVDIASKTAAGASTENWMKALRAIDTDAREALRALEVDLRALMGDNDNLLVADED